MTEVIGIDHIYIAVSDIEKSAEFYDVVMAVLGFRKQVFELAGEPHIQYFNRQFGYVLRPARETQPHQPYAPGLHHLCLRVESVDDLKNIAADLARKGIEVSEPACLPEYADDYYAIYFKDPDGLELEITNYRHERKQRHDHW